MKRRTLRMVEMSSLNGKHNGTKRGKLTDYNKNYYDTDSVDKPDSNTDHPEKENSSLSIQSDLSGHDNVINTLLDEPFNRNIFDESYNSNLNNSLLIDIPTEENDKIEIVDNAIIIEFVDNSIIAIDDPADTSSSVQYYNTENDQIEIVNNSIAVIEVPADTSGSVQYNTKNDQIEIVNNSIAVTEVPADTSGSVQYNTENDQIEIVNNSIAVIEVPADTSGSVQYNTENDQIEIVNNSIAVIEVPADTCGSVYNTNEQAQSDQDITFPGTKPFARKKRKNRLEKRNSGKTYFTSKGKTVRGRSDELQLSDCRMKCKIWLDTQKKDIFHEYWNLKSHTRRVDFVSSLISKKNVLTSRKRVQSSLKHRSFTYEYSFNIHGERKICCKKCFLVTLDETEKFIRVVIENKNKSVSGITSEDSRGSCSPPNKTSEAKIQEVRNHITSFPTYESHYTRRTNDKLYLPSHLTLNKMYELYRQENPEPVGKTIYQTVFKNMNIRFKLRKADTCHKCDVYKMQIQMEVNEEKRLLLINERNDHVGSADLAYEAKRKDKEIAKTDETHVCIVFDLQQCLATPFILTSVAFYKRQYWTYNCSTHNLATGQANCYLWHENIARRGANEIGSCIYKELINLPESINTVTLYSDSCGGQNKNSHIAAMFIALLKQKPSIQIINHKFLVPGHTHMECDSDHSQIEKQKKKSEISICHPRDWATLMRCTNKRKPFIVHELKQNDFYDFASLVKGPLIVRNKDEEGNKFLWHDCAWIRYDSTQLGLLYYKTSLNDAEPFKVINFKRRNKSMDSNFTLKNTYNAPVPISKEKKKDLLDMLPLIPNIYHNLYKNLTATDEEKASNDPDLYDSDDNDNNHQLPILI